MPFPASDAAVRFATPQWFEEMPIPIPQQIPDRPELVVEHHSSTPAGHTIVHQQVFDRSGLAAWLPGRSADKPHLILARPSGIDAGDLLGRAPASDTIAETVIIVGQHQQTCPLGVAGTHRPGLAQAAADAPELDVLLQIHASPFGDAEISVRLHPSGTQSLLDPRSALSDTRLRLHWETLIFWLHTPARLAPS